MSDDLRAAMDGVTGMIPTSPTEPGLVAASPIVPAISGEDRWRAEVKLILTGAGWVLPIQVGSSLLGYVTQIAAARWMGASEYGVYTYAYTWLAVLGVLACIGLDTAVLRFIPDYIHRRHWSELRGLTKAAELLPFSVGVGLAVLGSAVAIAFHLFNSHFYIGMLLLTLWAVPLQALAQVQIGKCRAIGAAALAYAPLSLGFSLVLVGGYFIIWRSTGSLDSRKAMEVTVLALVLVLIVQRKLFHSILPPQIRTIRASYHVRAWLSVSSVIWLSAVLENLRTRSHLLMLGLMKPAAEVGIYNVAQSTATPVLLVLGAFMALGAPRLAALYSQGRREVLQDSLERLMHWIFWPSVVGALLIWWSANLIFPLFGREFVRARPATMVLLLTNLVDAGIGPVGWLLDLTGNQLSVVRARVGSVLIGLILDVLLIPRAGVTGAAIAASVGLLVLAVWLYALNVKLLDLRPSIVDALLVSVRSGRDAAPAR